MVLSSGVDNLNPQTDLNTLYAFDLNVVYKVEGNSINNYPTTDKGLLIVTNIDNVILQTYITKKRIYRRYGDIRYGDTNVSTTTYVIFTDWIYEIYGLNKDIATETDYGLVTETRIKDLIRTYAPAFDPTEIWTLVNTKASQVDLDGKINKAGDTFYNDHTFNYLETINGNFHMSMRDGSGSYSFYRRSPDNTRWQYMMGLNGTGGIEASVGGVDHYEIHNLTSGVRSYIKSYNNGEGDVAYIEDLSWKWLYDGQGNMQTFTISGGNIPSQANEILVEFWLIHGRQVRNSRNLVSDYHESNWHSVPLKWGGGYAIYHWGNTNIHINQDGIYHRGYTGRKLILTSGSNILAIGTAPRETTPPPDETITPSYVRRVMWR